MVDKATPAAADHLLFVERRPEAWGNEQQALERRKAWTATDVAGALKELLPADDGSNVASVYAEIAHRHGWLTAEWVLSPAEYASILGTIDSWAAYDRTWADVTSIFGPPSVLFGGTNPLYGKTLGYATEDPSEPMLFFHLWNGTDSGSEPSWPPAHEQPLLLAVRHGDRPFPAGFTFTPAGQSRQPAQEECHPAPPSR